MHLAPAHITPVLRCFLYTAQVPPKRKCGILFYVSLSTILKLGFKFSLNSFVKKPLLVALLGFGYALYHYAYVLYPILQEKVFALSASPRLKQ